MAHDAETTRLVQAIERFTEHSKDVSPQLQQALAGVNKAIEGPDTSEMSPGERAAYGNGDTGKGGTGVPMERAAKGPDAPSPGQRAAAGVGDEIRERAKAIIAANTSPKT